MLILIKEDTKMSKKFTEEQYQKIVEIGDEFEEKGGLGILDTLNKKTIGDVLFLTELASKIEFYPNSGIIMAIANPLTREWAHDQFVEKEKKFYWTSKKRAVNDVNKKSRIYREEFSGALLTYIRIQVTHDHKNINEEEQLTESEIREWGYNPEMFDREEV